MPEPGSKAYEVQRRDLRDRYDQEGVPDRHATQAANEELQGGTRTGSAANATERVAGPAGERDAAGGTAGPGFPLRSSAFSDGALLPERYSKEGGNVPPPLEWSDVPDGTAELAVVVDDLDVPGGFVHWAVTGIDPATTSLEDGAPAGAREWPNGFGDRGYGGPRPPVGDEPHRYRFRVLALPEPLDAGADTGVEEVLGRVAGQAVATGAIVGRFGR